LFFVEYLLQQQYAGKDFGTCPLVQCDGQPVLPCGLKDEMGVDTVKLYCPKCQQLYVPPPARFSRANGGTTGGVDSAAFGTTFPHLFLMTFKNLVPDPLPMEARTYVPRVFGFRIYKPESAAAVVAINNNASNSSSTASVVAVQQDEVILQIEPPPAAPVAAAAVDTNDQQQQPASVATTTAARANPQRSAKRKPDGKKPETPPTCLMDHSVSKRRRKNGST
jgi:hypothetical protein